MKVGADRETDDDDSTRREHAGQCAPAFRFRFGCGLTLLANARIRRDRVPAYRRDEPAGARNFSDEAQGAGGEDRAFAVGVAARTRVLRASRRGAALRADHGIELH